jgi:hypothetical protein
MRANTIGTSRKIINSSMLLSLAEVYIIELKGIEMSIPKNAANKEDKTK